MEETITTTVLRDTADCFLNARRNVFAGAAGLYRISKEKLYLSDYTAFGDYVEQECQISQSYASKLIKAYQHYVVEGGLSQRKLDGVDPERLYLALSLPGGPEQQLAKAETLSRQELKAELLEEKSGVCSHEQEDFEVFKRFKCGKWEKQ